MRALFSNQGASGGKSRRAFFFGAPRFFLADDVICRRSPYIPPLRRIFPNLKYFD